MDVEQREAPTASGSGGAVAGAEAGRVENGAGTALEQATNGESGASPHHAGEDCSSSAASGGKQAPNEPSIEELAARKRKLAIAQDESRKRSKRMFGVLLGTLGQAKKEVTEKTDAAKKRQEIEDRLASKLRKEKEELEAKERRTRETRQVKLDVVKKEEDIQMTEHILKRRHDNKLALAGYLCTDFAFPPPPPASDDIPAPFAPRIPHAVRIPNPNAPRPIYYLPRKLLPFQEDKIEDQIAAVKQAIRREKQEWSDAKGDKIDELEAAKRRRDDVLEEEERVQREERQKRRRETEQEEEKQARARDDERRRADEGAAQGGDDQTPPPESESGGGASANAAQASTPSLSVKGAGAGESAAIDSDSVKGASQPAAAAAATGFSSEAVQQETVESGTSKEDKADDEQLEY